MDYLLAKDVKEPLWAAWRSKKKCNQPNIDECTCLEAQKEVYAYTIVL
jgi:hypothetical protein